MSSHQRQEGRIFVHTRGFGFLAVEDAGGAELTAFVAPPQLNPFLGGDRVSARIEDSGDGRFTAVDLELVERWRTRLLGEVVSHRRQLHLRVDRQVSNTDWPLEPGAVGELSEGSYVVAALAGDRLVAERVVAPADASLLRVIVRHGLRIDFSDELVEAACAAREQEHPVEAERRDLRALPTITIDAPWSRDLDDALAVLPADPDGGLRLLVSIADVDSLVPEGSPLDEEARLRGTSTYLAGQVVPMLPPQLSESALSLLPGVDRRTLTVELRLDPEGRVTAVDIYPSVIRSTARLSYEEVAELFDTDRTDRIPAAVVPTLRWLRAAAARLATVRAARGGVRWLREESAIFVDEQTGEPTKLYTPPHTSAHDLIEKLMVAANEAVAGWLIDRGLPAVFRVHDQPDDRRVLALGAAARNFGFEVGLGPGLTPRGLAALEQQLGSSPSAAALYTVLGGVLGPARYTAQPSLHFGLAAPRYLHFTSPIRRYADLAVHRVVKAFLSGRRDLAAHSEQLAALAADLNRLTRAAKKAETERRRMLVARLFADRIEERFHGGITAVKPFGLVVQLGDTGALGTVAAELLGGGPFKVDLERSALVGPGASYTVGEPLEVVVLGVDEELGRIDLGPV